MVYYVIRISFQEYEEDMFDAYSSYGITCTCVYVILDFQLPWPWPFTCRPWPSLVVIIKPWSISRALPCFEDPADGWDVVVHSRFFFFFCSFDLTVHRPSTGLILWPWPFTIHCSCQVWRWSVIKTVGYVKYKHTYGCSAISPCNVLMLFAPG